MSILFGKLTLDALPHQWFTIGGTLALTFGGLAVAAALTYFKKWKWLWQEWLTSTDPKRIGIMYIVVAAIMFFRGALDTVMIWLQQSVSVGASHGYLTADHFQQIFTAHGDIMVFFVTMGFLFGLLNILVPLQIGARDVAFPFLNTLGFWLYVAGAILLNLFFVFGGDFAATGWLALSPLSELQFSPGVGIDYWIWSLQISGLGTLLGGINLLVTILKMRAPGMSLKKMPMFTWGALCSMVLVCTIFPVLTVTIALLNLDRFFGMHFFTTTAGGNAMMYVNLIWSWGHPEVYVLILPSFGIFSEIVSVFSQKRLFGYATAVWALIGVAALSGFVWLHHFFTMGAGANVNAFFGIMTTFIAIPTGVQVFNWLFTMYKGRIILTSPMYWFLGFIATFTLGGMAGVLMAIPSIDFQVHNSLFLVAHFHTMVIGGALFGIFAGLTYWFPKVFGFKLNERLGKRAFWFWLVGFFVSFVPLYILGLMGATRRLDHYTNPAWQPLFITSAIGVCIIGLGVATQVWQVVVSIKQRKQNRGGSDPWNARTLEWATASPPPVYNFAVVPEVADRDAFWEIKKAGQIQSDTSSVPFRAVAAESRNLLNTEDRSLHSSSDALVVGRVGKHIAYQDIVMPKNTALGIYVSAFCFVLGFAMVWHIIWLAIVGLIGAIVCVIISGFDEETEYIIPAAEVARMENQRTMSF